MTIKNFIDGLITGNNSINPANYIDILNGEAASDDAVVMMELQSAITKRLNESFEAGHNKGGLRAGLTKTANTWYGGFCISGENGAADFFFDPNFSTPVKPDGFTRKRLVSAVQTKPVTNEIRPYRQINDWFFLEPAVESYPSGVGLNALTTLTVCAPPVVGTIVKVTALIISATGQAAVEFMNGNATPSGYYNCHSAGAGLYGSLPPTEFVTDGSGQIKAQAYGPTTLYLRTLGFKLP